MNTIFFGDFRVPPTKMLVGNNVLVRFLSFHVVSGAAYEGRFRVSLSALSKVFRLLVELQGVFKVQGFLDRSSLFLRGAVRS